MNNALNHLRAKSVLRAPPGKPFKLKSGAESMHYVDVRLTALTGYGLRALVLEIHRCMEIHGWHKNPRRLVAGVALGGCPLATGLTMLLAYDALYVRPEAKDHGTGKLIEGIYSSGDRVVLLEDVITSGGSTLKAIGVLRAAGLVVEGVVAVLDRQQGGLDAIRNECPAEALFTLEELLA